MSSLLTGSIVDGNTGVIAASFDAAAMEAEEEQAQALLDLAEHCSAANFFTSTLRDVSATLPARWLAPGRGWDPRGAQGATTLGPGWVGRRGPGVAVQLHTLSQGGCLSRKWARPACRPCSPWRVRGVVVRGPALTRSICLQDAWRAERPRRRERREQCRAALDARLSEGEERATRCVGGRDRVSRKQGARFGLQHQQVPTHHGAYLHLLTPASRLCHAAPRGGRPAWGEARPGRHGCPYRHSTRGMCRPAGGWTPGSRQSQPSPRKVWRGTGRPSTWRPAGLRWRGGWTTSPWTAAVD